MPSCFVLYSWEAVVRPFRTRPSFHLLDSPPGFWGCSFLWYCLLGGTRRSLTHRVLCLSIAPSPSSQIKHPSWCIYCLHLLPRWRRPWISGHCSDKSLVPCVAAAHQTVTIHLRWFDCRQRNIQVGACCLRLSPIQGCPTSMSVTPLKVNIHCCPWRQMDASVMLLCTEQQTGCDYWSLNLSTTCVTGALTDVWL